MTHVTEQALEEAMQALRAEHAEELNALKRGWSVQITEAHNNCAGITLEDVQREIASIPKPDPGISAEDVEALIDTAVEGLPTPTPGLTTAEVEQLIADVSPEPGLSREDIEAIVAEALPQEAPEPALTKAEVEELINAIPGYDDDELKKRLLKIRAYSNGLADRIGAPRMEG